MSRVIVTGATGFLGQHMLPFLAERGFEVHALSRRSPPATAAGVEWHQASLFDQEELSSLLRKMRCSHLVHLAWYTTPPLYWEAPENTAWVNASLNLFRAFAEAGGRRILAAGSCAEYSWEDGCCREDTTPLEPTSLYGRSKETVRRMLNELASTTGISAVWARVFFPYGPGEHPTKLVSSLSSALLKGETAECATPNVARDFIYAVDAASALDAVLVSNLTGAVNIGNGAPIRIRQIAEKVAHIIGRVDLLRYGNAPTEDRPVVADVTKLRDNVHWTPRYSLDDGVAQTVEWVRYQLKSQIASPR
jgi:nucleoside-diphosphate-sugar epimerase